MSKFIVLKGAPGAIEARYVDTLPSPHTTQRVELDNVMIIVGRNEPIGAGKPPFYGNIFSPYMFTGGDVIIWAEHNGLPVDVPFKRAEFDELDTQFGKLLRQCRLIHKSRN